MRISDWSSDVCSSDLRAFVRPGCRANAIRRKPHEYWLVLLRDRRCTGINRDSRNARLGNQGMLRKGRSGSLSKGRRGTRSEEHTSELQSLMRISYAVFCLKKKKK